MPLDAVTHRKVLYQPREYVEIGQLCNRRDYYMLKLAGYVISEATIC